MKHYSETTLKNGKKCIVRNGEKKDGAAVFEIFNRTHEQTDYLLSYPEENSFDAEQEGAFLQELSDGDTGVELIAVVDGEVVGSAGFDAVGKKYKVKHRAEFGISVDRSYWGLGIGSALTETCIKMAKEAGYTQLELDVVADNDKAIALYKKYGFVEYGRNPRGFNSKLSGYQELVYMRKEL